MPKRRIFFSFHYALDAWRAAQVRNMGLVEGNAPVSDNDWERVTRGGEEAIERWIAEQMHGRTCTIVLVGAKTADRPWINYEICKSWNDGKGLVGIYVHGLKNQEGRNTRQGTQPVRPHPHRLPATLVDSEVLQPTGTRQHRPLRVDRTESRIDRRGSDRDSVQLSLASPIAARSASHGGVGWRAAGRREEKHGQPVPMVER